MRWGLLVLDVAAILACYLILFLPVAAADTTVKVWSETQYPAGSPFGTELIPDLVSRSLSLNTATGVLSIDIENATADGIATVYIYNCQDKVDPVQCVGSVSPQFHTAENGSLHLELDWSGVRDKAGYPETARFVFVVKVLRPAGSSWVTFWDKIVRTGQNTAYPVIGEEPDTVDLIAEQGASVGDITAFIQQRAMLPFNTAWKIIKVVFPGASKLYQLRSAAGVPAFTTETTVGNEVTVPMEQAFSYVFPESGKIFNGVSLLSPPSYTLGNGECEAGLGESSAVPGGCWDCPCISVQYCDGPGTTDYEEYSCRPFPSLGVVGSSGYVITNCYESHDIWIIARIDNPPNPTGLQIESQTYTLGGTSRGATSCTALDIGLYNCTITVPADPECGPGEYTLSDNSLEFGISFVNGSGRISRTLTADFPDIVVGSWTCGQDGCEAGLGEDYQKCCYDCSCPSGQYCDWDGANVNTGECKGVLSDADLQVSALEPPLYFKPYTGEPIGLGLLISPRPSGLAVSSPSCSITCSIDGVPCSASCSLSCSENPDTDDYNATCQMVISVAGYDQELEYVLNTDLNFPVSYRNGPGQVTQTLKDSLVVSFGASVCGDHVPGADETSENCCHDVGCPEGQFCDMVDPDDPTSGVCRPLGDIQITGVQLGETSFTVPIEWNKAADVRATPQIRTTFNATILGLPDSFDKVVSKVCALDGQAVCSFPECAEINPVTGKVSCDILFSPIPFDVLAGAQYNPDTGVLTFEEGIVNFTIRFIDGPESVTRVLNASLPDITIQLNASCGNKLCDADFGEDAVSCCIDCPCSDPYYFTPPDGSLNKEWICIPGWPNENSTCTKLEEITLLIQVPEVFGCEVLPEALGSNCTFSPNVLEVNASIPNAPTSLTVTSSRFEYNGEDGDVNCLPEPLDQNQNYTCGIELPDIANAEEGTEVRSIGIVLGVSYELENLTEATENLTDSRNFTVNRTWSADRRNCTRLAEKVNSEIDDVEDKIGRYRAFGYGMLGTAVILWVAAALKCGWCFLGGCLALGVGSYVLLYVGGLETVQDKLETVRDTEVEMCEGGDAATIRSSIRTAADENDAARGALTLSVSLFGACLLVGSWVYSGGSAPAATEVKPVAKGAGTTTNKPFSLGKSLFGGAELPVIKT